MKKLLLFLTLLIVGISANAQFSPSNNLNYIKLLKNPPVGTKADSVMVFNGTDKFVKMIPKSEVTEGKEDITNKTSVISGYSETLYPNEKATHDGLDLKLNISDLPTNLTLYPTTAVSDVSGYVKMVTDIHDVDYNTVAVDVSTSLITTTNQLVSSRISAAGVLIGQPGVFNITTFGNIRHLSGSGTASFYFEVYQRNAAGVETLICTSSNSLPVTNGGYSEFSASGVWDDGDFLATDRIVIKSYANRIVGGSDPIYQFQFGGASPVRTILPVPFSVVDAGYEVKINKVSTLTASDVLYPNNNAVIAGLATKQNTLVSGTSIKTIEGQSILGGGNIDLTKSDVGLSNVDNTSDAAKPVSTAQQTALNLKANISGQVFTGAISATNLSGTNTGDQVLTGLNYAPTSGSANYIQNGTAQQTASMNISGSGTFGGSVTTTDGFFSGIIKSQGSNRIGRDNVVGDKYITIVPSTTAIAPSIQGSEAGVGNANISINALGGNVLIGTTTANGSKLQVAGAATFSSSITATSFNGSATLTGTPTAPTAAAGTNTTQIATTAFVLANTDSGATSGSYTPTLTAVSNLDAVNFYSASYTKIGDIVTVTIGFYADTTTANTLTRFSVSLPFNRGGSTLRLIGSGTLDNSSLVFYPASVYSLSTTNAEVTFNPVSSAANFNGSASFQYNLTN